MWRVWQQRHSLAPSRQVPNHACVCIVAAIVQQQRVALDVVGRQRGAAARNDDVARWKRRRLLSDSDASNQSMRTAVGIARSLPGTLQLTV